MKSDSRWQWAKRPRWAILLIALGLFVGWWLWPITLYEAVGRYRTYKITLPNSSETAGGSIAVMPFQTDLWRERERLEKLKRMATYAEPVPDLGRAAYWIRLDSREHQEHPNLLWNRSNVTFSLVARKLEGHWPGSPQWKSACERIARETDAEFLNGTAGSYEIKTHRIPRVIVLARSAWDQSLRRQGVREPLPWWRLPKPGKAP